MLDDIAGGTTLRAESAEDIPFLQQLFFMVRAPEFSAAGWPEEQLRPFLAMQEQIQRTQYGLVYSHLDRWIVEHEDRKIGRLYLAVEPDATRIVEISLLPEVRGRGLGTALLQRVLAQAHASGRDVVLSVDHGNPAEGLYRRLGFKAVLDEGIKTGMRWSGPPL